MEISDQFASEIVTALEEGRELAEQYGRPLTAEHIAEVRDTLTVAQDLARGVKAS